MSRSTWKYYSVKLIFQMIVTGEPIPERIDGDYSDRYTFFEESIMLVRAQSFKHAYAVAERNALKFKEPYTNIYGQLVETKLVDAIDCFLVYPNDKGFTAGTELYSSISTVEKATSPSEYMLQKYEFSLEDYDLNNIREKRRIELQRPLAFERFSRWKK